VLNPAPVLARGRAAAEALMVDACTIQRKTGESTSTTTGAVTPTYSTLYTGKCRIQQRSAEARVEDTAEQYDRMLRLEVQLPMSVTGLKVDDRITVTASAHDADLVGRQVWIRHLAHKTHATARRLVAEELT
jgi:hypothetical protein